MSHWRKNGLLSLIAEFWPVPQNFKGRKYRCWDSSLHSEFLRKKKNQNSDIKERIFKGKNLNAEKKSQLFFLWSNPLPYYSVSSCVKKPLRELRKEN